MSPAYKSYHLIANLVQVWPAVTARRTDDNTMAREESYEYRPWYRHQSWYRQYSGHWRGYSMSAERSRPRARRSLFSSDCPRPEAESGKIYRPPPRNSYGQPYCDRDPVQHAKVSGPPKHYDFEHAQHNNRSGSQHNSNYHMQAHRGRPSPYTWFQSQARSTRSGCGGNERVPYWNQQNSSYPSHSVGPYNNCRPMKHSTSEKRHNSHELELGISSANSNIVQELQLAISPISCVRSDSQPVSSLPSSIAYVPCDSQPASVLPSSIACVPCDNQQVSILRSSIACVRCDNQPASVLPSSIACVPCDNQPASVLPSSIACVPCDSQPASVLPSSNKAGDPLTIDGQNSNDVPGPLTTDEQYSNYLCIRDHQEHQPVIRPNEDCKEAYVLNSETDYSVFYSDISSNSDGPDSESAAVLQAVSCSSEAVLNTVVATTETNSNELPDCNSVRLNSSKIIEDRAKLTTVVCDLIESLKKASHIKHVSCTPTKSTSTLDLSSEPLVISNVIESISTYTQNMHVQSVAYSPPFSHQSCTNNSSDIDSFCTSDTRVLPSDAGDKIKSWKLNEPLTPCMSLLKDPSDTVSVDVEENRSTLVSRAQLTYTVDNIYNSESLNTIRNNVYRSFFDSPKNSSTTDRQTPSVSVPIQTDAIDNVVNNTRDEIFSVTKFLSSLMEKSSKPVIKDKSPLSEKPLDTIGKDSDPESKGDIVRALPSCESPKSSKDAYVSSNKPNSPSRGKLRDSNAKEECGTATAPLHPTKSLHTPNDPSKTYTQSNSSLKTSLSAQVDCGEKVKAFVDGISQLNYTCKNFTDANYHSYFSSKDKLLDTLSQDRNSTNEPTLCADHIQTNVTSKNLSKTNQQSDRSSRDRRTDGIVNGGLDICKGDTAIYPSPSKSNSNAKNISVKNEESHSSSRETSSAQPNKPNSTPKDLSKQGQSRPRLKSGKGDQCKEVKTSVACPSQANHAAKNLSVAVKRTNSSSRDKLCDIFAAVGNSESVQTSAVHPTKANSTSKDLSKTKQGHASSRFKSGYKCNDDTNLVACPSKAHFSAKDLTKTKQSHSTSRLQSASDANGKGEKCKNDKTSPAHLTKPNSSTKDLSKTKKGHSTFKSACDANSKGDKCKMDKTSAAYPTKANSTSKDLSKTKQSHSPSRLMSARDANGKGDYSNDNKTSAAHPTKPNSTSKDLSKAKQSHSPSRFKSAFEFIGKGDKRNEGKPLVVRPSQVKHTAKNLSVADKWTNSSSRKKLSDTFGKDRNSASVQTSALHLTQRNSTSKNLSKTSKHTNSSSRCKPIDAIGEGKKCKENETSAPLSRSNSSSSKNLSDSNPPSNSSLRNKLSDTIDKHINSTNEQTSTLSRSKSKCASKNSSKKSQQSNSVTRDMPTECTGKDRHGLSEKEVLSCPSSSSTKCTAKNLSKASDISETRHFLLSGKVSEIISKDGNIIIEEQPSFARPSQSSEDLSQATYKRRDVPSRHKVSVKTAYCEVSEKDQAVDSCTSDSNCTSKNLIQTKERSNSSSRHKLSDTTGSAANTANTANFIKDEASAAHPSKTCSTFSHKLSETGKQNETSPRIKLTHITNREEDDFAGNISQLVHNSSVPSGVSTITVNKEGSECPVSKSKASTRVPRKRSLEDEATQEVEKKKKKLSKKNDVDLGQTRPTIDGKVGNTSGFVGKKKVFMTYAEYKCMKKKKENLELKSDANKELTPVINSPIQAETSEKEDIPCMITSVTNSTLQAETSKEEDIPTMITSVINSILQAETSKEKDIPCIIISNEYSNVKTEIVDLTGEDEEDVKSFAPPVIDLCGQESLWNDELQRNMFMSLAQHIVLAHTDLVQFKVAQRMACLHVMSEASKIACIQEAEEVVFNQMRHVQAEIEQLTNQLESHLKPGEVFFKLLNQALLELPNAFVNKVQEMQMEDVYEIYHWCAKVKLNNFEYKPTASNLLGNPPHFVHSSEPFHAARDALCENQWLGSSNQEVHNTQFMVQERNQCGFVPLSQLAPRHLLSFSSGDETVLPTSEPHQQSATYQENIIQSGITNQQEYYHLRPLATLCPPPFVQPKSHYTTSHQQSGYPGVRPSVIKSSVVPVSPQRAAASCPAPELVNTGRAQRTVSVDSGYTTTSPPALSPVTGDQAGTRRCEVCLEPATLCCMRCYQTYYCCEDHVVSDWMNRHGQECRPEEGI